MPKPATEEQVAAAIAREDQSRDAQDDPALDEDEDDVYGGAVVEYDTAHETHSFAMAEGGTEHSLALSEQVRWL